MKSAARKNKLRTILRWILWVFIAQFVLINISAVFYGYKLSHFYEARPANLRAKAKSENVFEKTWRIFSGSKYEKTPVYEAPHFSYDVVQLKTKSNINLEAWYMQADSAKGTIIMFHGLSLNKSFQIDQAYEYRYFGFNVMMVDFRAHGNSGGNTTTLGENESEDVKLAYDFIVKKGEKNIVLYGMSLGSVAIAKAIYDYNIMPSKIILDEPFLSLRADLQARAKNGLGFPAEPFATLVTFWMGVERGFNGFKLNTVDYVEKISCPVLMQYGAMDKLVPRNETDKIFNHIRSTNKKLVIYENAGHEFYLRNDLAKWRTEIESFLLR